MKKSHISATLMASLLFAGGAVAAPTIELDGVTYAAGAGVVESVKTQCQIEEMLTKHIQNTLKGANKRGDASKTAKLKIEITHVLGVGGGAYSGPKAITVQARLTEDGAATRTVKINRWSIGGLWGGFKGTCSILERCAVTIAKDLSRWSTDPKVVLKEEEKPPEETAGQAPAGALVPSPTPAPVASEATAPAEVESKK